LAHAQHSRRTFFFCSGLSSSLSLSDDDDSESDSDSDSDSALRFSDFFAALGFCFGVSFAAAFFGGSLDARGLSSSLSLSRAAGFAAGAFAASGLSSSESSSATAFFTAADGAFFERGWSPTEPTACELCGADAKGASRRCGRAL
jgi:hypothetical protein